MLEEATRQLDIASEAQKALKQFTDVTPDLDKSRRAWEEFLIALNRVWLKAVSELHQAGHDGTWFQQWKAERNTDALLRYVREARHADEHQHALIVAVADKMTISRIAVEGGLSEREEFERGRGQQAIFPGCRATIHYARQRIVPIDVGTRKNERVPVPTTHRDLPIYHPEHRVAFLAELALDWYRGFLEAAKVNWSQAGD
jgi:hypothetical protein